MKTFKKITFLLLCFILILSTPITSVASNYIDIPTNWSREAIEYSIDKGYIKGEGGRIHPEKEATVSELISLLNNTMDKSKDHISYEDVLAMVEVKPEDLLTREMAFGIIAMAYDLESKDMDFKFKDHDTISDWARDGVYSMYRYGYASGDNGKIMPKNPILKQEIAQIIYNMETPKVVDSIAKVENKKQLENLMHDMLKSYDTEIWIQSDNLDYFDFYYYFRIDKTMTKVLLKYPEINYGYNAYNLEDAKGLVKINLYYTTAHLDLFDKYMMDLYAKSDDQMEEEKSAVESKIQDIISKIITDSMTTLQKEKAIHDWIILNGRYDHEDTVAPYRRNNYTPYGILIEGLGVCESYAKSFYLLAKEAGIEVIYVTGDAGEYHAWNMVKLDDGKWYHIDPTWNDLSDDEVSYKYFNLTDEEMFKDHTIYDDLIDYPKADGTQFFRDNLDFHKDTEVN